MIKTQKKLKKTKRNSYITITVLKCRSCGQVIWSRYTHDYRTCKCGKYFIDGGRDYVRLGGPDVGAEEIKDKPLGYETHVLKIPRSYADITFVEFGDMCMTVNKKNGWPVATWDSKTDVPVKIGLLHSEVSEALEAFRKNDFCEYMEELADVFVRTFDQGAPINPEDFKRAFTALAFELYVKIQINALRGYRHGNKRA